MYLRPEWPPEPQSDKDKERYAELALTRMTYEEMRNDLKALGAKEVSSITELGKMLGSKEVVVRRENPELLMQMLTREAALPINPVGNGVRYANCALWDGHTPAGLNNAFLEGYGHKNHVAAVFGFDVKPGMDIEHLEESASMFAGMERSKVRSFMGSVGREQVRFVVLRFPLEALTEETMTPDEAERYDAMLEQRMQGKRATAEAFRAFFFK